MIVEFTGCSGAGKSTLCGATCEQMQAQGIAVRTPLQAVLGVRLARLVASERVGNIVLDVVALPWFLWDRRRHREFYRFASATIRGEVGGPLARTLLLRSVVRKLGLHSLFSRRKWRDTLIVVDEGSVHSAHVIFVNGIAEPNEQQIASFCSLVPRPELLVHVRADVDVLLERTLSRPDKPIRAKDERQLVDFITRAAHTFDRIFATGFMAAESLRIDTGGADETIAIESISTVANFVRDAAA